MKGYVEDDKRLERLKEDLLYGRPEIEQIRQVAALRSWA
jgi:hypothetical protein